mgnify:CR=1 FL=1
MSEPTAPDLQVEDHGAVRLIRLVRPAAKNALTLSTIDELDRALALAGDSACNESDDAEEAERNERGPGQQRREGECEVAHWPSLSRRSRTCT